MDHAGNQWVNQGSKGVREGRVVNLQQPCRILETLGLTLMLHAYVHGCIRVRVRIPVCTHVRGCSRVYPCACAYTCVHTCVPVGVPGGVGVFHTCIQPLENF
jgi:hypothetical protein